MALLSMCICTLVSAADTTAVINLQGGGHELPVAYLGEYVELSNVLGGYAGLAYWNAVSDPATDTPTISINITRNIHRYYLDPAVFKVGIWYRWDGKWEPHGNLEAFQIKAGSRPASNITVVATPATTSTGSQSTTIPVNKTHMVIARGDTVQYTYQYDDAGARSAYIWLFGDTSYLYGERLTKDNSTNIYTFNFTPSVTQTLQPAKYTGYLQFVGKRQDVFYNATTKSLETPYIAVPAVPTSGFSPSRIKAEFEKLEQNKEYTDDVLVPITADIRLPELRITDYYETNDRIYVRGDSSLAKGTEITFALDPERYVGVRAVQLKTYVTYLTGNLDTPREYFFSFPIVRSNLAIGKHTLVVTVNKSPVRISQSVDIEVKEVDLIPTPTREQIVPAPGTSRQIIGSSGWQRVVAANGSVFLESPNGSVYLVPAPTPQVVYVTQTPQIVYVTVTVPVSPPPTAPVVTRPADEIVIPLPPEITGLAILCAGYLFIQFRKT